MTAGTTISVRSKMIAPWPAFEYEIACRGSERDTRRSTECSRQRHRAIAVRGVRNIRIEDHYVAGVDPRRPKNSFERNPGPISSCELTSRSMIFVRRVFVDAIKRRPGVLPYAIGIDRLPERQRPLDIDRRDILMKGIRPPFDGATVLIEAVVPAEDSRMSEPR